MCVYKLGGDVMLHGLLVVLCITQVLMVFIFDIDTAEGSSNRSQNKVWVEVYVTED